ncbi:MAG: hypothetical protein ABIU95_05040, partial [Burkholderiales bacterium]
GVVRRYAYSMPDHFPSHWLTMMFGDRVEFVGYRLRKALPFVVPIVAIGLELGSPWVSAVAAVVAIAGVLVERWLFFAEARHVVRAYHGERAA